MKRQNHYLTHRYGQSSPSILAALDCTLIYPDLTRAQVKPEIEIAAGCLAVLKHRGRGRDVRKLHYGGSADLQGWLYDLCRPKSTTWLVCMGMHRLLSAIRFYDAIDGKSWLIRDPHEQRLKADGSPIPPKWSGFAVLEDRCGIMVIKRANGGTLHVVDSRNLGIASWGKLADDLSDSPQWPEWARLYARLQETDRCVLRSISLLLGFQRWCDWCREFACGPVQHTLSSQAMYCYRKSFLRDCIIIHNHQPALTLERKALYGGRCECYQIGHVREGLYGEDTNGYYGNKVPVLLSESPIHHLDSSSLYGHIAATNQVPAVFMGAANANDIEHPARGTGCIADVTVCLSEPIVPYRPRHDSETVWPIGTFRTTLCQPELDLVMPYITKVHEAYRYKLAWLFLGWAPWCWKVRTQARARNERTLAGQLKAFSQVLYGKWAQRRRGWIFCSGVPAPDLWSLWWEKDRNSDNVYRYRSIGGRVERYFQAEEGPEIETQESCPQITAWVYSLARVWLWRAINAAGRNRVYYVDTDSLWVDSRGLDSLQNSGYRIGPELGDLRIVATHQRVEFIGQKHYVADGVLTAAGVLQVPDPDEAFTTEGVSSACARNRAPRPYVVKAGKRGHKPYVHGEVLLDGRVVPIVIGKQPTHSSITNPVES